MGQARAWRGASDAAVEAVRQLVDAGIDCGVLMAPIVPGFSTQPAKIEATIKAIADSGATSIGAMVMHMDGGTKDHFMAILQREYPDLVPMYETLYASRYVKKDYEKKVQEVVSLMRQRYGVDQRRTSKPKNRLESVERADPQSLQLEE